MTNPERLKAIIEHLGLGLKDVADVANVSKTYVCRVINESDDLSGSAEFWLRIEGAMPILVGKRKKQYFAHETVDSHALRGAA